MPACFRCVLEVWRGGFKQCGKGGSRSVIAVSPAIYGV
jgi:hypothetical protein